VAAFPPCCTLFSVFSELRSILSLYSSVEIESSVFSLLSSVFVSFFSSFYSLCDRGVDKFPHSCISRKWFCLFGSHFVRSGASSVLSGFFFSSVFSTPLTCLVFLSRPPRKCSYAPLTPNALGGQPEPCFVSSIHFRPPVQPMSTLPSSFFFLRLMHSSFLPCLSHGNGLVRRQGLLSFFPSART